MSLMARHFAFLEVAESRNVYDNKGVKLDKPEKY